MKLAILAYYNYFDKLTAILIQDIDSLSEQVVRYENNWCPSTNRSDYLSPTTHHQAILKHGFEYIVNPLFNSVGIVTNSLIVDDKYLQDIVVPIEQMIKEQSLPSKDIAQIVDKAYPPKIRLGKLVQEFRQRYGIETIKLAKQVQISPTMLERIEKGERIELTPFLLRRLAEVFRVQYKKMCQLAGLVPLADRSLGGNIVAFSTYCHRSVHSDREEELLRLILSGLLEDERS